MARPKHDPGDLKPNALAIHWCLCREYGCLIAYSYDHDPLSELISSLLSHRSRNAASDHAFKTQRTRSST
jgi:endonuclease III